MSPLLQGLRTVIYPSAGLPSATAWWTNYLGFGPYFDEPFYVGFNVGGYELGLVPSDDHGASATTYWAVDDVGSALASAVDEGSVVREEPQHVGDGIITATTVTPHGHVVGLIFNPHFVAV